LYSSIRVIAYLSNQFPSPVEPYVWDEIRELRKRGVTVVPCSVRRAHRDSSFDSQLSRAAEESFYLQPLQLRLLLSAACTCVKQFSNLRVFSRRILHGNESLSRRVRALAHTFLGAYYAHLLAELGADHIHVHHGYFSAWIAMVAARLLNIDFSMTLHGSDLLLHAPYLDLKLESCKFCLTVSDYNRRHILQHYPRVDPGKIIVHRLGVDPGESQESAPRSHPFVMLSVGRLHAVKNHAFLLRACRALKDRGLDFLCLIAGEGPERPALERLLDRLHLRGHVQLLGHIPHAQLDHYYSGADLVVLTSHSEGIPLALMEAMAHSRIVLAPSITGIPELVLDGQTGFLSPPGSLTDFLDKVETVHALRGRLGAVERAARAHVLTNFNRSKNLARFGDLFLARLAPMEHARNEDPVLQ
jgi:glycosyltransferase involved in cell wall biosynthesis